MMKWRMFFVGLLVGLVLVSCGGSEEGGVETAVLPTEQSVEETAVSPTIAVEPTATIVVAAQEETAVPPATETATRDEADVDVAAGEAVGETAVVNANEPITQLSLTEATYLTDSFLGPQTEDSIYAGNCLARLLNNGQMVLYGNGRFELTFTDTASVADCFALENGEAVGGTFDPNGDLFAVSYDFDEPLMVQNGTATIEITPRFHIYEQLPSGNLRGGFGFTMSGSSDTYVGDLLYLVAAGAVASAAPAGESVPPIEVAYAMTDALAGLDAPIIVSPPPDFVSSATANDLFFNSASRLPAAEAVTLYKGYLSSLGWLLVNESMEGSTTSLGFARNGESGTIRVQAGLATAVTGFFQLFGEPWTAVPAIPLLADAQLAQFSYSQNFELPADTSLDEIAQYYEGLATTELAAAGWALENSSGSDSNRRLSWMRPSGQSSVDISDVPSLNKVGVTISYQYDEPAIAPIDVAMATGGAAQLEALLNQLELGLVADKEKLFLSDTAVAELCSGAANIASAVVLPDAATKQSCAPAGTQIIEFVVGYIPYAIVINGANDWATEMTTAEAVAAFTTAATWAEVNPAWPDSPIPRFVPPAGSAAYHLLVDELLGGDETALGNAANLFQLAHVSDLLGSGIDENETAIGFVPLDAVEAAATAVSLDGNAPDSNNYPLTLPLLLLTFDTTMQTELPVATLISHAIVADPAMALAARYRLVDEMTRRANEALWLQVVGE